MALFGHILAVTFPFFALVVGGYLVTVRRLLPVEAIPGLNVYVLYLSLPAMLFNFASHTPIAKLMEAGTVAVYIASALLMLLLAVATSGRRRLGWNDASYGALVAAFPNSGFLGVPLLVAMLGQQAAAPAIVSLSIDMVMTTSICIGLSRWGRSQNQGAAATVAQALRGMLVNPLPWAILLGSLSSGLGVTLPRALDQVVRMLAQSASPVALVVLGAMLARPALARAPSEGGGPLARLHAALAQGVGGLVAYKLIVHPVLVTLVGLGLAALGLPLDHDSQVVLILVAALPSASNVPILAERFGADAGRIARVVMISTVLASLSFPLIALRVVPEAWFIAVANHQ